MTEGDVFSSGIFSRFTAVLIRKNRNAIYDVVRRLFFVNRKQKRNLRRSAGHEQKRNACSLWTIVDLLTGDDDQEKREKGIVYPIVEL